MEEFKKVAPDYEIGTQGTARSLKFGKVKVLSPSPNKNGYLRVCLRIDGKQTVRQIHRLVAEAFIPNPLNLPEVNHINGGKTDNRVENLEWMTKADNLRHAHATGLIVAPQGEDCYNAKFANEQVTYIRDNPDGLTQRELAAMFDVTITTISQIQTGRTYKTAGGTVRQPKNLRVPDDVREQIRRLYAQGGISMQVLAKNFGVDQATVWNIVNRR